MKNIEKPLIEAVGEVVTKVLSENPNLVGILEQRLNVKRKEVEERKKLRSLSIQQGK